MQETPVVPEPMNGSNTVPSGGVVGSIQRVGNSTGKAAGCPVLPVVLKVHTEGQLVGRTTYGLLDLVKRNTYSCVVVGRLPSDLPSRLSGFAQITDCLKNQPAFRIPIAKWKGNAPITAMCITNVYPKASRWLQQIAYFIKYGQEVIDVILRMPLLP
jgi:hypothetical protein